ncbi:MAG: alpha/beta hydrolase domain-containing protein [Betaproteobacteria bacterium]
MKQRRLIFATGGYIPFARTKAERALAGDPRLSLEERYGNRQGYVCVVRKAVQREVGRRFLLAADGERLIAQAASSNVLAAGEGGDEAGAIAAGLCRG